MAEVTGYTAERMKEIEDASVVNGHIDPATNHLILTRFDDSEIDAGYIGNLPLRDTSANLASTNPVVAAGRLAIATDSNPRVFAIGDGATAWNSLKKFEEQPIYGTYVPTLGATTTNPNAGSTSTKSGRYVKHGRLVMFDAYITFAGTGITAGSGNYMVGLPFPAVNSLENYGLFNAHAIIYDASANVRAYPKVKVFSDNLNYVFMSYLATQPTGTEPTVAHNAPWTWAASDSIMVSGSYISQT